MKRYNSKKSLLGVGIMPTPLLDGKQEYFNVISYYGGKYHLLEDTLDYIEKVAKHNNAHTYAECFGGGGKCILNLDTVDHSFQRKIYNEWSSELCNIFRVLSDERKAELVYDMVNELEYSKELFDFCKKNISKTSFSEIEKAVMTYVLIRCSYNSNMKDFSKYHIEEDTIYRRSRVLLEAPEYLKNVEIIKGDYRDIMKEYGDDPRVIKYLDPPYHPLCRNQDALKVYPNELSREQHIELVDILCKSRGWILAGYDPEQYGCDDYKPMVETGAMKVSLGRYNVSTASGKDNYKEEFIWYKY